jgi:hypothetical protein
MRFPYGPNVWSISVALATAQGVPAARLVEAGRGFHSAWHAAFPCAGLSAARLLHAGGRRCQDTSQAATRRNATRYPSGTLQGNSIHSLLTRRMAFHLLSANASRAGRGF